MIGGGITKVRDGEKIVDDLGKPSSGSVAPLMYFFVDDIEEAMEKAKEMGGKVLLGRTTEGKTGEYAVLQDTECVYTGLRCRFIFQSFLVTRYLYLGDPASNAVLSSKYTEIDLLTKNHT